MSPSLLSLSFRPATLAALCAAVLCAAVLAVTGLTRLSGAAPHVAPHVDPHGDPHVDPHGEPHVEPLSAVALPHQDPSLPVAGRVDDLPARMTLDDELGQMAQAEKGSLVPSSDLATYRIGSVLSGGDSMVSPNTARTWADTYDSLQRTASMRTDPTRSAS
ncbi:hypothetical protein [Streptomyces sp. ISL-36]|uniref:hypothetical protein n=1 Tax=Streptomyces sp. ISL-36 TaxID=2819182 RepID=UPI0020353A8E|nr:hypothetical protein [Streptomyces sp. ISL-36]